MARVRDRLGRERAGDVPRDRVRDLGREDRVGIAEEDERRFLSVLILRLVEELDLTGLTVALQDWGGPIGLWLAVEQPERVERLAIMNTGVGGGRAPNEVWLRFRDVVRRISRPGWKSPPAARAVVAVVGVPVELRRLVRAPEAEVVERDHSRDARERGMSLR